MIPHATADYSVYLNGTELLGIAEVTLPEISFTTEELSGAGISGKSDIPLVGMLESMTLTLNWRQLSDSVATLAAPKKHNLDLRYAGQGVEIDSGITTIPGQVMVSVIPKKTSLGKLAIGKMDASTEFEVLAIQATVDGAMIYDIDKTSWKCEIGGTDFAADIRSALGK